MSLFRRNKDTEYRQILAELVRLREQNEQLSGRLTEYGERLSEISNAFSEYRGNFSEIGTSLAKTGEEVGRHDMILEDLLESMEEQQQSMDQAASLFQQDMKREAREQVQKAKAGEARVLGLVLAYRTQLDAFFRMHAGDTAWQRSLEMSEELLKAAEQKAGIIITGKAGEAADPELHEILDVKETHDPGMDRKVAEVYGSGCVYDGQVIKKAAVTIWKLRTGESE